jgi:hypothetical protein
MMEFFNQFRLLFCRNLQRNDRDAFLFVLAYIFIVENRDNPSKTEIKTLRIIVVNEA